MIKNSKGQIIGRVLADGTVVDMNNNPIGFTGSAAYTGQKVYASNGSLIGIIDKDGIIRDSYGNVIGHVAADGSAYNLNGEKIGIASGIDSARYKGKAIYDAKGNIIGIVNEEGMVVDNSGKIIGAVTSEGSVVDFTGSIIGEIKDVIGDLPPIGANDTPSPFMGSTITPTVFDNSGAFGAYGNQSFGKGGGFGPGERYSKERISQLNALQAARRAGSSWARIDAPEFAQTKGFEDKDWSSIGFNKYLSSRPVNMNRVIVKGKAIPAVLVNSIDSRFNEVPVTAVVERNIYGSNGRNIVIPAGSWIVGTSEGEQAQVWVVTLQNSSLNGKDLYARMVLHLPFLVILATLWAEEEFRATLTAGCSISTLHLL